MLTSRSVLLATDSADAYAPQIHVERARLGEIRGDDATRRRELGEAHRLFTEMGATMRADQIAKELA